jgi:SAM-dependent methyltransferase
VVIRTEWDAMYGNAAPAPWDIGRPQREFVALAGRGLLRGAVLDAGCGSGEHTLLAAEHGADALGVDFSARAIEAARAKAAARGSGARFEVADALALDHAADTVLDSGLFHTFDDEDRTRYVASLAGVLRPGGRLYLMCFSDRQPGEIGPRRVSREEIAAAFAAGWAVEEVVPAVFEVVPGWSPGEQDEDGTARAWLATVRRT